MIAPIARLRRHVAPCTNVIRSEPHVCHVKRPLIRIDAHIEHAAGAGHLHLAVHECRCDVHLPRRVEQANPRTAHRHRPWLRFLVTIISAA